MGVKHKHYDVIVAWASGQEIECLDKKTNQWISINPPSWYADTEYRVKPKKPEWWENIPEHGILVEGVHTGYVTKLKFTPSNPQDYKLLTNEEIERFKR